MRGIASGHSDSTTRKRLARSTLVRFQPHPFVGTCKQVPTFVVQYSFSFSATRQQEKYHAIEVRNVQVHCP